MKYPIGIQDFESIIKDDYVYVDKTELIYRLVTEGKIYFLSRPRRFGKSLLVSTLEAYFKGRKDLFKGLAIDKLETEWAEYPVFHIDFNGSNFTKPNVLEEVIEKFLADQEYIYGKNPNSRDTGSRFKDIGGRARSPPPKNGEIGVLPRGRKPGGAKPFGIFSHPPCPKDGRPAPRHAAKLRDRRRGHSEKREGDRGSSEGEPWGAAHRFGYRRAARKERERRQAALCPPF